LKLPEFLFRKKLVKAVVSQWYDIDRTGSMTTNENMGEHEDWLATIQEDYDSGRIKGSPITWQNTETGSFGGEIPPDVIVVYKTEAGQTRYLSVGFCYDLVVEMIDAFLKSDGVDFAYVEFLDEVESYLRLLARAIQRGSNVESLFSMNEKQEWKGTLKEMAIMAIDNVNSRNVRNLSVACRKLAETYHIDGEAINLSSLYSLARQIQSGSR